ncbi:MAG: hypothetical protein JO022_21210 [Acidobacteriaceae bacterium]|nr:hypothetical protein [Acidobacteriaceae bacterium]
MKNQSRVGLIVEGNSTNSAILRLPQLSECFGPIKSTLPRVARRLSNLLRAGYAVTSYEELQSSRLILVRVPDDAVPRVIEEICISDLDLNGISLVLCETWLTTDSLAPLVSRGAFIATLLGVPRFRRQFFILEGDVTPVRQMRRLIEQSDARALAVRPGTKSLFFAAELLTTALPVPFLAAAQEALRLAGVSGNPMHALVEEMSLKMFRDFSKGSRGAWGGPLNACSRELSEAHLSAVYGAYPELAAFLDEHLASARRSPRFGVQLKQPL